MMRGIDYIEPNETGPLHEAVLTGDLERIHDLIKRGADVDPLDERARTPLHLAAERGDVLAVKALLEAGANAHSQDLDYRTPEMAARAAGHRGMAELLREVERVTKRQR